MNDTVLRLQNVTKGFGRTKAVRGADLTLSKGRTLALLGPSGCGKTTTLRLLAGFERPDTGEIEISGQKVAADSAWVPPERRRVGMVFQDYALFPHLTVERNVLYGLPKSFGKKRTRRADEVLSLVHLTEVRDRMPHELSGGQQQRVALARALAPEPAVVLLDEPFSNLDAALRTRVRAEMRDILHEAGATTVFVTHDQEEALSFADEVAVMFDGRIVQTAPPEDVYHRPETRQVAEFVGEANFLPGVVQDGRVLCELGELPLPDPGTTSGEVEAMLRPEALGLREDPQGPAVVTGREFYGHDQLITLRLEESGKVLHSRLGGGPGFRPGERVAVEARGAAVVFSGSGG